MKYILSLFFIVACFLTGCHHQGEPYGRLHSSNIHIGISNVGIGTYSQTTGGMLTKNFTFTGRHTMIEFSGHILTYSGMFSINIPNNLDTRSYEAFSPENLTSENLVLSEHTHIYYVNILSRDINFIKPVMTEKQVCLSQTEYSGVKNIVRNVIDKNLTGKHIFITNVTIPNPGNNEPYLYSTHICFLDTSVLYDIVMDTYHFFDVQQNIDSFSFGK